VVNSIRVLVCEEECEEESVNELEVGFEPHGL
jgi:hypothetical protein